MTNEEMIQIISEAQEKASQKFEDLKVDDPKAMHYLIAGEDIVDEMVNSIIKKIQSK